MSRKQMKNEIEAIITCSGHPADKRMQCSLRRILKMRHPELNAKQIDGAVAEFFKECF